MPGRVQARSRAQPRRFLSAVGVPGDTNGNHDVFLRDLVAGTTRRVNLTSTGGQGNGDDFYSLIDRPSTSGDGRYVAFASYSTNLVPRDTIGRRDIFVRDTIG